MLKQWWADSSVARVSQNTQTLSTCDGDLSDGPVEDPADSPADFMDSTNRTLSAPADRPLSERTRMWRRRALLRKGARLCTSIGSTSDFVSLAMLDEAGIVVAWYERGRDLEVDAPSSVVDRHHTHLYASADVTLGLPERELHSATLHGSSSQKGWQRGSDGVPFWALTVIEPLRLRDGRLQGFSYVTYRRAAPWRAEPRTDCSREQPRRTSTRLS